MSDAKLPNLDQLKELPVPPPVVSYFPQTWGWLVLLLVVLLALAAWAGWRYWQWRRDRYRRDALARLDALEAALADEHTRLPALRELPELLKRVALSMPQRPQVATLGGADWQAFLTKTSSAPLPEGFGRQLATLAYAPVERVKALPADELQGLLASSRHWIETHHVAV
ncbi:DUF4381 domain-containing protein [Pseudomonas sp. UL073]|uniref:DUF4381 domain-containing protein n=1 Tax=Zestomonas insulae TaxID=2809017 RepID=A0ABS2IFG5_9GAMM|nr:DUF4381 domain-containing protein [Pseudomonas insulae]MBM7061826.1 DUF4381 domain-containing protein [Pseudomonas insulae]